MAVKTYSKSRQFNLKLSAHFTVGEFACPDSDVVKISDELVVYLEKIRNHFLRPVIINSGYRTYSYDKKVGGGGYGQHTLGKAADIKISSVDPLRIADFAANTLKMGGVECGSYSTGGYVHTDVRNRNWRAVRISQSGSYETVKKLYVNIKRGSKGQTVSVLERKLKILGFYSGKIDGIAGSGVDKAIRSYQKWYKLSVDGIFGPKCWAVLLKNI